MMGRERRRDIGELTEAEERILGLASLLPSNVAIAQELHISINTLRTHISRIYAKLGIEGNNWERRWKLCELSRKRRNETR